MSDVSAVLRNRQASVSWLGTRLRAAGYLVLAVLSMQALAAERIGAPPHVSFAIEGENDGLVFQIERDSRGIVYLGHESGVLEYDGESWTTLPIGAEKTARDLLAIGDRLFVGGYGAFGELVLQADGQRRFHDLTPLFADALQGRAFADIWDIIVSPDGIYFRALRDVFRWHPDTGVVRHWHHPDRFGEIAFRNGETWLQFRGEGFRRLQDDDWQPVPGTSELKDLIHTLLPLGGSERTWLSSGAPGEWWRLSPDGAMPAVRPAGMAPSTNFEHADRLDDGSLALASSEGTVVIVAPDLSEFVEIRLEFGFLGGVKAIPGGAIVAGSRGFHHITWPSALTVVDESQGAVGALHGMATWNQTDYLLTSAGALPALSAGVGLRFAERSSFSDPAFMHDLLPLDTQRAVLASSHRLLLLEGGQTVPISQELAYPREFHRSTLDSSRVYVSGEDGLRILELRDSGPTLAALPAPETAQRINSVVEISADEVLAGSERHGLRQYLRTPQGDWQVSTLIAEETGIRYGGENRASVFQLPGGRVLASTSSGLFERRGDQFQSLSMGNLGALRQVDELWTRVFAGADGNHWAFSESRLMFSTDGSQWIELPSRRLRRGAFRRHTLGDDGEAIFVSDGALVIHQPGRAQSADIPAVIQLRRITQFGADGARVRLPIDGTSELNIESGAYAVDFRYALADLNRPKGRQYRARLLGYESEFSEWNEEDGYSYFGLNAGSYQFEAQARDAEGRVSAIRPFKLVIAPAWHETWWARTVWLLLLVIAALVILRVVVARRTQRLVEQTQQLESTVAERTKALAEANRRLDEMAHVDGLTGISNRRRIDLYLADVHAQCVERERPLGILAIDADRFKAYNDRHGHLAGDEVLRRLTNTLLRCLRRSEDLLGRFGGEEFLVILPGASLAVAQELAERMRSEVAAAEIGVTVSIGVASGVPDAQSEPEASVARADAALYRAKQAGRNRVESDPGE
ncbi:MAG: diguanylate cyclase [Pseudomarimonas sp.]